MFYVLKRDNVNMIRVGDRCMVLADFSGVPAGTRGEVVENYGTGVMVKWEDAARFARDPKEAHAATIGRMFSGADGFGEDELEYLAFETKTHPFKVKLDEMSRYKN